MHPPSTPEQLRAQGNLIRASLVGSLARDMMLGGLVVAFAVQVLDFTNGQISGFLTVLPLTILARYPFLDAIRRLPRIYPTRAARIIQIICLSVLFVLPTEAITPPLLLAIATVFLIGNDFLQNAVWTTLVSEITTRADRGRFFGRLRTWKITTALAFSLFGFFLVGEQMSRVEHRWMLAVVLVLLINGFFWMMRIPPVPPPATLSGFSGRGKFWEILRTSPLLRRPLALDFIDRIIAWPILTVYLIGALHLPANLFMLSVVVGMLGPIASNAFWGSRADRMGVRKLFAAYFVAIMLLYPVLLLVPDFDQVPEYGTQWMLGLGALLLFTFVQGVLVAGHEMATSVYHAQYLGVANGFHAINILTAMARLVTSAMTAIGGLLLVQFDRIAPPAYEGGTSLLWLDPMRLIMLGVVMLAALAGIIVSRGIGADQ